MSVAYRAQDFQQGLKQVPVAPGLHDHVKVLRTRMSDIAYRNESVICTFRWDGVKVPEYRSGWGLSSHLSARKPPHCVRIAQLRKRDSLRDVTHECSVSQKFDVVPFADVRHSV